MRGLSNADCSFQILSAAGIQVADNPPESIRVENRSMGIRLDAGIDQGRSSYVHGEYVADRTQTDDGEQTARKVDLRNVDRRSHSEWPSLDLLAIACLRHRCREGQSRLA